MTDLPRSLGAGSAVAIVAQVGRDRDYSRPSYKNGITEGMIG